MDDQQSDKPAKSVNIAVELDEQIANGQYVNLARIFHSPTEFVLDAVFLPPGTKRAKVRSRLILSPTHAKQLLTALGQNIRIYENKFGEIKVPTQGMSVLH